MSTARQIISVAGLGLWLALQNQCLHAQSEGAASPGSKEPHKAEKSLLPEAATKPASSEHTSPAICQCVSESDSAAVERIERALRAPLHSTGLDFVQTPLKDVVDQLATEYGIPIQLDKTALDEVGINEDQQVSVNLHNVSLRSGLRLMLKTLQLTYIIRDEVLILTTPDAAEKDVIPCVYNVNELVRNGGSDLESIADMIRTCVEWDTWAKNGGSRSEIRAIKPDLLVISQTDAVHQEIRDLLSAIHKIHEQPAAPTSANNKSAAAKHDEIVTRSYILQVTPANESQARDLIVNAFPDEIWSGRLPDGQPVQLAVIRDRIVVRQTPEVQAKLEKMLSDSGIAIPASQLNAPGMVPGFGGAPMERGPGGGFLGVVGPGGGPEGPGAAAPAEFGAGATNAPGFGGGLEPSPSPGQ
jgi:hypothetical protein